VPFRGSNSFDVAASILNYPAYEIGAVPSGLALGIRGVVARLLEKRREDRPSSFVEVKLFMLDSSFILMFSWACL
jgi:hypothetical protein